MAKNDTIKQEKEAMCVELLKANPASTMKEVNEEIRKKFDSGVAGAIFSRLKKELASEDGTAQTVEAKISKPKKTKAKAKKEPDEISVKLEDTLEEKTELIEDDETVAKVEIHEAVKEENQEPEVEEEPEIPVEKYPFNIRIRIPEASTVFIAGTFNKWKKDEYRLEKEEGDWWVYDDKLPEGNHNYKFVVNNREWYVDFDSEIVTDDTGVSNTLVVEPV